MERRDVAEDLPAKRTRRAQETSDTEDDSGYHDSIHSSSAQEEGYATTMDTEDRTLLTREEAQEEDYATTMDTEERTPWTREDTISAE